jgi:broad specificity phosphatase PhoE
MKRRAILIRHAETEGNKTRYVGREDLPLNETGMRQANALANVLRDEKIGAIFSSPLQRAIATAHPLALQRGLQITRHPGLTEIDYGKLQGNTKGEKPFNLRRKYFDTPMPGGESLRDVWSRLQAAADDIQLAWSDHASIAIVGHYWSNRLLACMLQGRLLEDAMEKGGYRPENASAYAIDFENGAVRAYTWLHSRDAQD